MRAGGGGGGARETGKMTLRLVSILSMALLLVLPAQLDAFITQNTGELRYGNMRENYGKTKRLPG